MKVSAFTSYFTKCLLHISLQYNASFFNPSVISASAFAFLRFVSGKDSFGWPPLLVWWPSVLLVAHASEPAAVETFVIIFPVFYSLFPLITVFVSVFRLLTYLILTGCPAVVLDWGILTVQAKTRSTCVRMRTGHLAPVIASSARVGLSLQIVWHMQIIAIGCTKRGVPDECL